MIGWTSVEYPAVEVKIFSVNFGAPLAAFRTAATFVRQMSLLLTVRQLWDLCPIACGANGIGGGQTHGQYNKLAGADFPLEARQAVGNFPTKYVYPQKLIQPPHEE